MLLDNPPLAGVGTPNSLAFVEMSCVLVRGAGFTTNSNRKQELGSTLNPGSHWGSRGGQTHRHRGRPSALASQQPGYYSLLLESLGGSAEQVAVQCCSTNAWTSPRGQTWDNIPLFQPAHASHIPNCCFQPCHLLLSNQSFQFHVH